MSKNKVTQEQIAKLISEAKIDVATVQEKCTVVTVTLKSGFILTESSACVDKANYNKEIGTHCCLERIERKLWELEGYALQKELAESDENCAVITKAELKEYKRQAVKAFAERLKKNPSINNYGLEFVALVDIDAELKALLKEYEE